MLPGYCRHTKVTVHQVWSHKAGHISLVQVAPLGLPVLGLHVNKVLQQLLKLDGTDVLVTLATVAAALSEEKLIFYYF